MYTKHNRNRHSRGVIDGSILKRFPHRHINGPAITIFRLSSNSNLEQIMDSTLIVQFIISSTITKKTTIALAEDY